MPKLKTKRTLAKRIKITASGKYLRKKNLTQHLREKVGNSRKHRKNKMAGVSKAFQKNFAKMLPSL